MSETKFMPMMYSEATGYIQTKGGRKLLDADSLPFDSDSECDKYGYLIAAAPDLYEALEAFFLAARLDHSLHPAWRSIRDAADAALAKARGEA